MVLFDAEGKIAKYNSSLDILQEFCKLRTERPRSPSALKTGSFLGGDSVPLLQ